MSLVIRPLTSRILIALSIMLLLISCSSPNIIIESNYFKYEIDRQGKNLYFTDTIRALLQEGNIPTLKDGDNEISFVCKGPEGVNSRVQVTVISEGTPLDKNN